MHSTCGIGTQHKSSRIGQLNDVAGPCGCMNFTCTSSSLSELDAIITPSHQCWSYIHVMYCPGFIVVGCGQSWLALVECVWLTDATEKFVRRSSDTRLIFKVELSIGRKQWCSRVPGTVLAFINRAVCSSACPLISSWDTYRQWMPLTVASAHSNSFLGVRIWLSTGLCKLARAANRLIVPPMASHVFFPWHVAKKCHSAHTLKSSTWLHKLIKFLKFLYCAAHPSLKYWIRFNSRILVLMYLIMADINP